MLLADTLLDFGKPVLFLNTITNCFEFKELFSTAQGYLGGKPASGCITLCPWEYSSGLI